VEHFKPAAHDAAANARFLLHVPVRHPELPAVSHLRQHPVYLFQSDKVIKQDQQPGDKSTENYPD